MPAVKVNFSNNTAALGFILLLLCSTVMASANATAAPKAPDQNTMASQSPGLFWRIFESANGYRWQTSFGWGMAYRNTPYSDNKLTASIRANIAYSMTPCWHLTLSADSVNYSARAANLNYNNTATTVGVGIGYRYWLSPFYLSMAMDIGPQIRTSSFSDGIMESSTRWHVKPASTIWAGTGLSFFGRSTFSAQAGMRYHPGRIDYLGFFSIDYYFGD